MNTRVKDFIKYIYYSEPGKLIRKYPQKLYFKNKCNKLRKRLNAIEHRQKTYPIKIVFVLEYPEVWNSSKTIFESFCNNDNTEAYILTLPKYPNGIVNEAYEFAVRQYKNVINGYDKANDKWFDLEKFSPDYIFYTRPYEKEYPVSLKPSMTSNYAKLCYVPYGFEFVTGYHIEVEYNFKTFPYFYMVFSESLSSKSYCEKLSRGEHDNKRIYEIGYPRFDLLYRLKQISKNKKNDDIMTILWTPRWSVESRANDGTSFFEFFDPLIKYFSEKSNENIRLIIRPHPLMFDNFVNKGIMSHDEVDKIKKNVALIQNVEFDINKDYLLTLCQSDFVISDYTSMLIEYLIMDIPVLYCGKNDNFDEIGKDIDKAMYHLKDYNNDVICAIDHIRTEGDVMSVVRHHMIEKLSGGLDGKTGERISRLIQDDYL